MTEATRTLAIVVPVHDPGHRLDDLLERLDAVRSAVHEIVVVDDGSPLEAAVRLADWAAVRPSVVLIREDESVGVAMARNRALERVTADYVWFVDDDDEWDDAAVPIISLHLRYNPDVLVFRAEYRYRDGTAGRIVDGLAIDETTTGARALSHLLAGRIHGFLWSKVFRRERLSSPLFPDLTSQSDVVGVARALAAARRVRFIPDVLYTYVRRPRSITRVSVPDFGNLLAARDHVLEAAFLVEGVVIDRATVDHFAAWFYCSAVLKTVVRQSVPEPQRSAALADARAFASTLDLALVRSRSLKHGAVVAALRASPRTAAAATAAAYALLDSGRAITARRRGRDSTSLPPSAHVAADGATIRRRAIGSGR
jgi:hypothetical protein